MDIESFSGPGSTRSRMEFWDKVTSAVIASRKLSGHNSTVTEYPGQGSLVNIDRNRKTVGNTGACCIGPDCSILTESACSDAGGIYQGDAIPCDPNPCFVCPDINTIELSVSISGKICSDSEPSGGYSTSKTFHRVTGSTGDDEFSLEDCNLIGPNDNGGFGHPPGRFEWNDGTLHPLFALIVNDGYALNELERIGYCSRTISTGMVWTGIGTFSFPISGINGDGTPWSGTVTLVAS